MAARIIAELPARSFLNYEEIRARLREFIDIIELQPKEENK
ncbi:hypothetical protein [Methanosarcina horonobensis]|nr:hypothetical protein [Methanosarcina horonobensis]